MPQEECGLIKGVGGAARQARAGGVPFMEEPLSSMRRTIAKRLNEASCVCACVCVRVCVCAHVRVSVCVCLSVWCIILCVSLSCDIDVQFRLLIVSIHIAKVQICKTFWPWRSSSVTKLYAHYRQTESQSIAMSLEIYHIIDVQYVHIIYNYVYIDMFVHVYIHVCVTLTIWHCTVLSSLARVPYHTLMSSNYCKSEMMLFLSHCMCNYLWSFSLKQWSCQHCSVQNNSHSRSSGVWSTIYSKQSWYQISSSCTCGCMYM